jgi:S1-C subfamily serine protease
MTLENQDVERLARCLNGVPVLGCSWGSVAAMIGLERGDVVIAVNGVKTPNELAFNYARSLRDDQLELEVVRDGETLRFLVGRERLRGFDPMFVLDEVVAMRFDVAFP